MEAEDEAGWDSGVVLPVSQGEQGSTHTIQPCLHALPESILLAILSCLSPKALASVACTDRLLRTLATKDSVTQATLWRGFFTERWKVSDYHASHPWHALYGAKVTALKCWSGRPEQDQLHGHRSAVRAVKLLPRHNLLATASLDKTVRLWDLASGVCLSVSKPHGGTVRCLALDSGLLASGCSDHLIRVWLPVGGKVQEYSNGGRRSSSGAVSDSGSSNGVSTGGEADGEPLDDPLSLVDDTIAPVVAAPAPGRSAGASSCACLFDLSQPASHVLSGHRGPVDALCLSEHALYSGSWDYSVRIWSRHTWECLSVLTYDDWVVSVASRGGHLLVAAGAEVYVHELQSGQIVRKFQNLHEGHVTCIEGSQNGRILFTGSTDGLVLGHDLRMREASVVLWHAPVSVNCLSFEDPWLACACADGTVVMINTEVALGSQRGCGVPPGAAKRASGRGRGGRGGAGGDPSSVRQLSSGGGPAYSVDIAEQYLACGTESDVVKIWNFTHAAEAAERQAAARAARNSARAARKQQHQKRMAAGGGAAKPGNEAGPRGRQGDGGGAVADSLAQGGGVVQGPWQPPTPGSSPPHSRAVTIGGQRHGGYSTSNGNGRRSGSCHQHHLHGQGSYGHSPGSSGTSPVMTHSFWPYASQQSPYSHALPPYFGSYDVHYHHQYTSAAPGRRGGQPVSGGLVTGAAGDVGGSRHPPPTTTSRHHHHQGSHRSAIAPLHLARSPGTSRQCMSGSSSSHQHSTTSEPAAGPSNYESSPGIPGAAAALRHGVAGAGGSGGGGGGVGGSRPGQRQQGSKSRQRQQDGQT